MFFMKLRLNVPFCDLAYRFDLTPKTVSQSFRRILEVVHQLMKSLVVFPSQEVCHSWLGEHELRRFPRLRAIIDYTEVSIARQVTLFPYFILLAQTTVLKDVVHYFAFQTTQPGRAANCVERLQA